MRRLLVSLATLVLVACGPGEIGENCSSGSATDDCVDGAVCSRLPAATPEPGDEPNDDEYVCRAICDMNADCPAGETCQRAEGTMLSSCQPDGTDTSME